MDPQVTLYDLLDAIDRNDREDVDQYLEALAEWNRKGGFLPEVCRPYSNDPAKYVVYRKTRRQLIDDETPTVDDLMRQIGE